QPVVRLRNCLGPMVPLEEFDDPDAVRRRCELLKESGAEPGAFGGVPELLIEKTGGETGVLAEGLLRVPESAPFFGDHFPRRPVFPGTLLMNANLNFSLALAGEFGPGAEAWRPRAMRDVKLRSFMPPGETLEAKAR